MRRLLALVAVASAVAFAAPAEAKPFSYSDPKDVPVNAGLDIVQVSYSTTGETTSRVVRGKRVRVYEPTKLVATMTLAGAPLDQEGVRYRVDAVVSECGNLTFNYAPHLGAAAFESSALTVGCGGAPGTTGGDTLFLDPKIVVKGSTITWTIPLKSLPKPARAGGLLSQLKSSVDVVEPVLGAIGPDDVGNAVIDVATSDADWDIG